MKISLCSSSLKYLPKVYIASERDVLTEILWNVSTVGRSIDALTSWFDNSSGKEQKFYRYFRSRFYAVIQHGNCAVFFRNCL